ncbi:hypothetical protein CYG68_03820 [Morganella morganii]|uniref:Uncharacterized protein n=1 Tax=Morganella morganii TaxID=582 RepID=A0A8I0Q2G7_MORMO|nr:hypothetical protein [Morganella morganii]MBE8611543.1 hypothetical protein [Morganella morganii]
MHIEAGFRPPFQRQLVNSNGDWRDLRRKSVTFPDTLLAKLADSNYRYLGNPNYRGAFFGTPVDSRILSVINAYLVTPMTEDELALILANRAHFEFRIGVGDWRIDGRIFSRFAIADNWQGEDVTDRVLTPEVFPEGSYRHRLTFSGSTGRIKMTDEHSGGNRYGSIRYLTIRYRG